MATSRALFVPQQRRRRRLILQLLLLIKVLLPVLVSSVIPKTQCSFITAATMTTTTITTTTTSKILPLLFQLQLPQRLSLPLNQRRRKSSYYASNNSNNNNNSNNIDLSLIEEHVMASVQSQMDTSRVLQALSVDAPTAQLPYTSRSSATTSSTTMADFHPQSPTTMDLLYDYERPPQHPPYLPQPLSPIRSPRTSSSPLATPYQISIAGALVCGTIIDLVLHNTILALLVSISVFLTAFLEDHSNLTGALVRMLGRTTIRSVQASEPKIKAIARVVITGQEDIQSLQHTIQLLQYDNERLQQENQQLQQWKATHIYIHQTLLPQYTLPQLKDLAQSHQLPVSGTKLELMERLLEAKVIQL